MHAIERMRAHPVYVQFERRWQLPVYFQLRWKEIVGRLEEALATTRLERTRSRGTFHARVRCESECSLLVRVRRGQAVRDDSGCGCAGCYRDVLERTCLHPRAQP